MSCKSACNDQPKALADEDLECGICLEKILQKADSRFGILNCEHVFCLACIRSWRSGLTMAEQITRSCPICRIVTHFVTPAAYWVPNSEAKPKLIEDYKQRLKNIPCKYFGTGELTCPFGTSCFYAHRLADGTEESGKLRTCITSDSQVKIVSTPSLLDYILFPK